MRMKFLKLSKGELNKFSPYYGFKITVLTINKCLLIFVPRLIISLENILVVIIIMLIERDLVVRLLSIWPKYID